MHSSHNSLKKSSLNLEDKEL